MAFTAISHLAIDTNMLIGQGWPSLTTGLDNVVTACRELGVPVLLSEITIQEAQAVWLRQSRGAVQKARQNVSDLSRRTFGFVSEEIQWPTHDNLSTVYDTAVGELFKHRAFQTVPLPNLSLADAVSLAVRHTAPFPESDSGFRDALIVLSLVAHVGAGAVLGVLSADKYFSDRRVTDGANGSDVTLVVFKTPEEALDVLQRMARDTDLAKVFEKWEKSNQRLLRALEADRPKLLEYLRQNVVVPEYPYGVSGRVETVRDIGITRIDSARERLPFGDSPDEGGSARVRVKVEVILKFVESLPVRRMKVGQSADDVSPIISAGGTSITDIDGYADVRLRVHWPEDEGAQPELQYQGVEFITDAEDKMRREAIMNALSSGLGQDKPK